MIQLDVRGACEVIDSYSISQTMPIVDADTFTVITMVGLLYTDLMTFLLV